MTETYWIGGAVTLFTPAAEALPRTVNITLQNSGVRPEQVESALWLGPLALAQPAGLHWPVTAPLDHAVLQNACRTLITGEWHLLLAGESAPQAAAAALLASPSAVGRLNLVPRARLTPLPTLPPAPDWPQALWTAAQKTGEEDEPLEIEWLACAGPADERAAELQTALPAAQWLTPQPDSPLGIVLALNSLVHTLEQENARAGLLLSLTTGQPLLATLLERI